MALKGSNDLLLIAPLFPQSLFSLLSFTELHGLLLFFPLHQSSFLLFSFN